LSSLSISSFVESKLTTSSIRFKTNGLM
jgi:hypothetical protein